MRLEKWRDLEGFQKWLVCFAAFTLTLFAIGASLNGFVQIANAGKMPYMAHAWIGYDPGPEYVPMSDRTRFNVLGDWIVVSFMPSFNRSFGRNGIISIGDIFLSAGHACSFIVAPMLFYNILRIRRRNARRRHHD